MRTMEEKLVAALQMLREATASVEDDPDIDAAKEAVDQVLDEFEVWRTSSTKAEELLPTTAYGVHGLNMLARHDEAERFANDDEAQAYVLRLLREDAQRRRFAAEAGFRAGHDAQGASVAVRLAAVEHAHDRLSSLLEDEGAGNDEVRTAAIDICDALNAFYEAQNAMTAPSQHAREGQAGDTAEPVVRLAIKLEGGLVHWVGADRDVPVEVAIIDYDTEGVDESELTAIPQDGGGTAEAYAYIAAVDVDPAFVLPAVQATRESGAEIEAREAMGP